jgi:haloalkane dehalogenase
MPTILRTPDDRFANLPDYPYAPNYVELDGVRMHYVDEGQSDEVILCLHGEPSWSYLYRHMIPPLTAAGYRVIAPDLIGFGRSDKFAEKDAYTFAMHAAMVNRFIQALDLQNVTIVVQDWGGLLGLNAVRLMPTRFARLVIMNTGLPTGEEPMSRAFLAWQKIAMKIADLPVGEVVQNATVTELSPEVVAAYDAPFPDVTYKAGAHIFPALVPTSEDMPGADEMKATRKFLRSWDKPALVMFSDSDPITQPAGPLFKRLIPTAKDQPDITIESAGHFLQEDQGPGIAEHIIAFMQRTAG